MSLIVSAVQLIVRVELALLVVLLGEMPTCMKVNMPAEIVKVSEIP